MKQKHRARHVGRTSRVMSRMVHGLRKSPIRRIAALLEKSAQDKSIISFGGGAPSLPPPAPVIEHLIKRLRENPQYASSYGSTKGLPHVLELLTDDLKSQEKISVNPETEITLTLGGTLGLYAAFQNLLNPGVRVIVSNPTYLGYYGALKTIGAIPTEVPVQWQDDFQLTPDAVQKAITPRTKAVILLSPDNPTGRVLSKQNLRGIVELCEDKNLWLITDDIYKDMIYGEKFVNSRKFGGYENTVTVCSFSKTMALPGFRGGYSYGPAPVIDKMELVLSYLQLSSQKPIQFCLEKFLENHGKIKAQYVKHVQKTYGARRDAMAREFKRVLPNAGIAMPRGAFYFFPSMTHYLTQTRMAEEQFVQKLYDEQKLVIIPGHSFGTHGRNHARFTFVSEPEPRIKQGFERLETFIDKHSK